MHLIKLQILPSPTKIFQQLLSPPTNKMHTHIPACETHFSVIDYLMVKKIIFH